MNKILGHRTHRKRLLFKVRWEGYTKDWDREEPVETFLPSYNKVWRDYLQKQNVKPLTSSPTLVDRSHELATRRKP